MPAHLHILSAECYKVSRRSTTKGAVDTLDGGSGSEVTPEQEEPVLMSLLLLLAHR